MAEALVKSAAGLVTRPSIEFLGQQLSLFAGATRELEKLSSTFESIQAVLADAETRQVGDQSVQLWLSRVRHAAYDIQDLLEDGRISGLGSSNDDDDGDDDRDAGKSVCACLSWLYTCLDRTVSRYKLACSIKEIRQRLVVINAETNNYSFSSSSQGGGGDMMLLRRKRQTTELIDESEMFIGRENEKETMISRLVSGSSDEDLARVQAVAIVGHGGLGKTTLARQIYNDGRVRDHFNTALWVCVSDVFDVERLIKEILEQVKEAGTVLLGLAALQKELLKAIEGKRFFLVLDDVWNEDKELWKKLRLPLKGGAQGSKILITTRSKKVAETMNATHIYDVKGLSKDDSWELFRINAFAGKKPAEYLEFENFGREIVNNCNGVPLSITVIGSAMYYKKTLEDWRNILHSKLWSLKHAKVEILPALWLTYFHLPAHLKQCFVYCSVFPKDWEFQKELLVRLWVAQGFIQSEGNREIEDIGDECFDELVAWSIFQEVKDCFGKIIYKMHDLLHDLAEFIAKDEIYTFISKSKGGMSGECSGNSSDVRHAFLSFAYGDDKPDKTPIAACRAKKLRTLWLHRIGKSESGIIDLIHEARFLRALYFPSSTRLPKSIGELKHLKYLHLPYSKTAELPESVSDLRNLHTLNLSHCKDRKKLPRGIGGMVSLRYLNLSNNSNMVELPESLGNLRNLHTLTLSDCKKLEKLPRGIGGMEQLRYLYLRNDSNIVELPESASDLRNLHTLDLTCCRKLEKLPRGIGGMEQLRYLYLCYNSNIVELPESVGDLGNLHTLDLRGCGKLKNLPRGTGGMVSLRHLEIQQTVSLEYLPKGLGRMSDLLSLSTFIVGGGDEGEGCGIDELQPLNSLQGTLQIKHLERVSSREEAKKAELSKKQHLCSLALEMSEETDDDVVDDNDGGDNNVVVVDDDDDDDVVVDDGDDDKTRMIDSVLEGMRPHKNLEKLRFDGCRGSKLPSWMDAMQCLQELVLWDGPMLERVPYLSSLKKLKILFSRHEILPDEGWKRLVALRELQISFCSELKCLPAGLTQVPSLENLSISDCDKLESLPDSVGQLRKLKSLSVCGSEVLTSLPDSIRELESLDYLDISNLKKLESVPDSLGQLRKLKSLCIGGSEVLTCLPDSIVQLESLECLRISNCEALASLPQGLRHLSLLETLRISHCPLLTERCKREGGVDWPNISHIPNIHINE